MTSRLLHWTKGALPLFIALLLVFPNAGAADQGDVDGNARVDAADAVAVLRVLAGVADAPADPAADINDNHRADMAEALYALGQAGPDPFLPVALHSSITTVQPMTGIVFWSDSEHAISNAIQLEYTYVGYDELVAADGSWNWTRLDTLLDQVADRGHQSIIRFFFVYPGRATTVPAHIKANPAYQETSGLSEGLTTWFPDWSSPLLQNFLLDFYTEFAARYNDDPRLAFLQVGFGLWGEYHIYDGPMELGVTFPTKEFQAAFLTHLAGSLNTLHWSISIDAAETERSPFALQPSLKDLRFGLFDDSFLNEDHHLYNADCFTFFSHETRHLHSPVGGELSYYSEHDQRTALDPQGPHGIPFEEMAERYHVSYMIGNDQPAYQTLTRIGEAGMATGYRFRVTSFAASSTASRIVVENVGISPIYYDAWLAVNGIRASQSLKGLASGKSLTVTIPSGGPDPRLAIEADRLVPGQVIGFEADLEPELPANPPSPE